VDKVITGLGKDKEPVVGGQSPVPDEVKSSVQDEASPSAESNLLFPKDHRTTSEIAFDLIQAKRAKERAQKQSAKSHRQKVEEFNQYLGDLSEHYDIPKVGPG